MLEWKRRGRRSESQISTRHTLETVCQKFAVASFKPKLAGDISPYYLALMRRPAGGEIMIGGRRFRTSDAAMAACEAVV